MSWIFSEISFLSFSQEVLDKGRDKWGSPELEVRTEISGKLSLNIVQRMPDSFSLFNLQIAVLKTKKPPANCDY